MPFGMTRHLYSKDRVMDKEGYADHAGKLRQRLQEEEALTMLLQLPQSTLTRCRTTPPSAVPVSR